MGQERTTAALGRIERALARIEAAAGGLEGRAPSDPDEELRGKHQKLRDRVEGAIHDIDRLLATRERG
jgi:hypothetical protein